MWASYSMPPREADIVTVTGMDTDMATDMGMAMGIMMKTKSREGFSDAKQNQRNKFPFFRLEVSEE